MKKYIYSIYIIDVKSMLVEGGAECPPRVEITLRLYYLYYSICRIDDRNSFR